MRQLFSRLAGLFRRLRNRRSTGSPRDQIDWHALDSLIDWSIYTGWQTVVDKWKDLASWSQRFRLTGGRKAANELASEGLNLGIAGLLVMLTLMLPAIAEIEGEGWKDTGQFSVTFLDRYGNEIGRRGILHSDAVPLDEIPDTLIKATLSTEDRRFFEHFGIDVLGTFRALIENVRANEVVQGGSSLTQQLAKNLFLNSERSLQRKIKEAFLSIWLEVRLTKREILKLYLDRAYMGGGAFGVEAAAQFYFGKSVRDISLAEAAMMAGLYKAPTTYAPHVNLARSRARANEVLSNLVEAGFMTEAQVYGARANPATPITQIATNSPDYFLDWAFEEVQRIARGKNEFVLTARTTIDQRLQAAADTATIDLLKENRRPYGVDQVALVGMELDGAVRALVGGKDYGQSQFNRATAARRQPGSSFKPYVYLTAVQEGYRPNSRVVDGYVACGRWSPKNYSGGYRGRMTMATALARSSNTVAVKLSLEKGRRSRIVRDVAKMGLKIRPSCSMALGDQGITVLQHTSAYATFATGGKVVKPYAIVELKTPRGEQIYLRNDKEEGPKQVFDPQDVAYVNQMLGQVITGGTGGRAKLDFTTAAGKTGTSSNYRDGWFMGFTGKFVTGVWYGNDSFRPTKKVTGGSLPAMAWKSFMTAAHDDPYIAKIPGLELHPNQISEMARLDALKRANPQTASKRSRELMPKATQKTLRQLFDMFQKALPEETDSTQAPVGDLRRRAALDSGSSPWR